jgi:prepilin-type N-terminal cleavage/methylation domain-containing protein
MTQDTYGNISRSNTDSSGCRAVPKGMTLVEMLVSMTVTLIMIGFVAQLFGLLGTNVSSSRALMETNDQLRSVAHRLRTDLAGSTVDPIPPLRPEAAGGYLEIVEGPNNDFAVNYTGTASVISMPNGDCDDALLFTTVSPGDPFIGRFEGGSIESPAAEVAWFCIQSGTVSGVPLFSLYRRQLLVTGLVGAGSFSTNNSIAGTLPAAYANYDLSLRAEGSNLVPNSLADLCKRENRFLNRGTVFPYKLCAGGTNGLTFDAASGRQGEDLMLTNLVSFDVRVFDPYAEIKTLGSAALTPGDPGYAAGSATSPRTYGAYVDLGAGVSTTTTSIGTPTFSGSMQTKSYLSGTITPFSTWQPLSNVYDTWSILYEFNGLDDDNTGGTDQGSNNRDDDNPGDSGYGIIDDIGERETAPPYPIALRGLEIRIRVYEPSSRQVRQVTVRHTFVPH